MRALLRTLPFAGVALLVGGCPPAGECQGYTDCPSGQYCSEGSCVDDNILDGGPGNNNGNDGGGLPRDAGPQGDGGPTGGDVLEVRTTYDVPWIQLDESTANRLLYAELSLSGGTVLIDQVRAINASTGQKVTAPVYELSTMSDGVCQPDSILQEPVAGETWFNCLAGEELRIVYDGNIAQPAQVEADTMAQLFLSVPGANATDLRRILVASRGGPLVSFRVQSFDGLGTPRQRDAINVATGEVAALFRLDADGVPGTHVLVHDRSADPGTLRPITRDPGAEQWEATAALDPLDLPAGAHAVVVFGPINASGSSDAPNEANFATIHPETGELRFWNYEQAAEVLPKTTFENDSRFLGPPAAVEERLLLGVSPSGQYVFYARVGGDKIWRIPLLTQGADNDVLGYEVIDATRELSSLVVTSEDTVWVSYGNDNLVERIRLTDPA